MSGRIVFNGKAYDSADEMPPDVREAYEKIMGVFADKNQDGMPDVFEGLAGTRPNPNVQTNSTVIIYEGRQYASVDELPPEARLKYEQAMGKLDSNRNMIPDFLEGTSPISRMTQDSAGFAFDNPLRTPPQPASRTIEPESTPARTVLITIGLFIVLCIFAALTFYFLNQ
jgi:hypothetical protein